MAAHFSPFSKKLGDGKRFPAVDVVSGLLLGENFLKMGGGPGGGGQKIGPDGRESDFSLCLKIAVLPACQLTLTPFSREIRIFGSAKNKVLPAWQRIFQ